MVPATRKNWDLEWEIPEWEQELTYDDGFLFGPDTNETPAQKKLKRELEREALNRMEESARTEADYLEVVRNWNRLDANRERRERYHEVLRGKGSPPLEWNADDNGFLFPAALNDVLARQIWAGDFIETIFYCPYDIHELVMRECASTALNALPDDRKELLFLSILEQWSTLKIAEWRNQTDRNIRKIRNTSLNRLRRKILPALQRLLLSGEPLTNWELRFLENEKSAFADGKGDTDAEATIMEEEEGKE